MKKGAIVKFSKVGLDYLYPVHIMGVTCPVLCHVREEAKKKRFKFSGVDRNDLNVVRVKRMTSNSYVYYHNTFIEPG